MVGGRSTDYCGSGCQRPYGECDDNAKSTSPNGVCSGSDGYTSTGSVFRNYGSSNGLLALINVEVSVSRLSGGAIEVMFDATGVVRSGCTLSCSD